MANTYLRHTEGTSPTDAKKFTFSTWIKRSKLGTDQTIFYNYKSSSNYAYIYFRGSQKDIRYFDRVGGGDTCVGTTAPMLFNDVNGWYNIVLKVDTTQSAAADKVQFYINGEYVAFNFDNVPNTNQTLTLNNWGVRTIGASNDGGNDFDGLMSYVAFIDGTAESANIFGETDTTTGQWKIKTTITPSVAWGNTGFFILKDGNSVTDQSGNSNNFTVSAGTLTKTEDNPSNVFATWNPLHKPWASTTTWSYGNTRLYNSDSTSGSSPTTLGANSGKYYLEIKQGNNTEVYIGVCGEGFVSDDVNNKYSGATYNATTGLLIWKNNGQKTVNGTSTSSYFNSYASGDILGIALDLDASTRTVTFYKNGVAESVGSQNLPTNMQTGYVFGVGIVQSGAVLQLNAGNGYFRSSAVSSPGTNASGIGIFEHDVPTGYTALSTKGLNL